MDQNDRIARIIQEYDGQGWHRTGTETDHQSARWLAGKARELGLDAELEEFDLSRVDPETACLEVDGQRIDGLPMFDAAFTGPEGIRGQIGGLGSSAEIGLGSVTRRASDHDALEAARRSSAHRALVAVTLGDSLGLMASNAPRFRSPFGPPVLQVSSEVQELLSEHAQRSSEVHLVSSVTRGNAKSFNVVGRLKGEDSNLPPLVVMTPRSGWWHCASERGGGLACWLEVMRSLVESGPSRDVIFLATSGHELGEYGIHTFLERRPGFVEEVSTWVHFGANIGAAQAPSTRFSATDGNLEEQTQLALKRAGTNPTTPVTGGATVGAESQIVARQGGRVVAIVGGNALFHLETDRWPEAVDVQAVAGFARAFTDVGLQLAEG